MWRPRWTDDVIVRGARRWNRPAQFRHCFSETIVAVVGFPSALVPLVVSVMVLPSFEMTVLPFVWYFVPVFFVSLVNVFASICLIEMVSQGAPVTGLSFPSYLAVYLL